jgi:hypothetical protein
MGCPIAKKSPASISSVEQAKCRADQANAKAGHAERALIWESWQGDGSRMV